jgi:hypothetical protein
VGDGGGGVVREAGEFAVALGGDEALAVDEDGLEAVVVALLVVELKPPEEGAGVLEETEIKSVLENGRGEVRALIQRTRVAALPGEFFEFFVGEAVFGADVFWGFGFGIGWERGFFGGLGWRRWWW